MRKPLLSKARSVGVALAAAAVATVGFTAPASAQEGSIVGADAAGAISDSYIVVFRDATTPVSSLVSQVTGRLGGHVNQTYSRTVHGYSATMSESQAKRVAADPSVAFVEQNRRITIAATQTNPPSWGLDRVDQRNLPLNSAYNYSTTASNVHAYIIDTGINLAHSDFGGRAKSGYDFIDNDADASDCNGHGTHVAGTVGGSAHGLAKAVQLTAVRVLDCAGSGTYDQVIAGIEWVTQNAVKPAVANMSLGGGVSTAIDNAVAASISSGVTYAIAAGNSNANACNSSPARVPAAITVGATRSTDARASYSNYGRCLDIFAPGSSITSDWIGSTSATNTISGTSMATPHVAGAAALYLATHTSATPQQVRDALVAAGTTGKVTSAGSNSPNVLLYTGN
ncbi:subtilisin family serine protease [Amycolatopsis thermophila]|uniref:Subtilisin family serine protease n=1 Tax=Amycolatopsis thermophila TaxID=206084 RepID=A0ABU0EVM5_9PSEU|nr:subtilisin family serine protease [Amycolatopsis thermophila]